MEINYKGEKYLIEKTDECFGYKDNTFYKCWMTKKAYVIGICLGRITFILDKDEKVLAAFPHMTTCNNDFELINRWSLDRCIDVVNAYNKFQEEQK